MWVFFFSSFFASRGEQGGVVVVFWGFGCGSKLMMAWVLDRCCFQCCQSPAAFAFLVQDGPPVVCNFKEGKNQRGTKEYQSNKIVRGIILGFLSQP